MARPSLCLLALVGALCLAPTARAQGGAEIDPAKLKDALDRGQKWLEGLHQPDGSFKLPPVKTDTLEVSFPMGYTALATLTLLKCGVPPDDPRIEASFQYLYKMKLRKTYEVSLLVLCIEARYLPPPKKVADDAEKKSYVTVARKHFRGKARKVDLGKLQECVDWLIGHRSKQFQGGGWRYPQGEIDQDNSNTQYAVLALKGARRLGANVPIEVFEKVADFFVMQQDVTGPEVEPFPVPAADGPILEMLGLEKRRKAEQKRKKEEEKRATRERKKKRVTESGEALVLTARGWSYEPRTVKLPLPQEKKGEHPVYTTGTHRTTGSMTCSGVAALCIAKSELELKPGSWRPRKYAVNTAIRDGVAWLAKYFDPNGNPRITGGLTGWQYYYYYSVERAGVLAGTYRFGDHDWWEEGAAYILAKQQADGTWPEAKGLSCLSRTCFALLFLKRSTIPLLPLPPKRVMTQTG